MKITDRQAKILNSTIETHIETAMPVASAQLRERYRMSYSSATVRHEMGILEDAGFLTHRHTSSGRIPTDEGYRYYVDHCLPIEGKGGFDNDLMEENFSVFSRNSDEPEAFIEQSSLLLAKMLRETSLVFLANPGNLPDKMKMFLQGASHILEKPEFQDINMVRSLFQAFDEKLQLLKLFETDNSEVQDVTIRIGQENSSQVFHACTVISTRYYVRGVSVGRIAIVGPKRMRYKEAIALVSCAAEMMGEILDQRF